MNGTHRAGLRESSRSDPGVRPGGGPKEVDLKSLKVLEYLIRVATKRVKHQEVE